MSFFDVQVAVRIERPPEEVWAYLSDVSTHVEWMQEAVSVEFLSEQRQGVGTSYNCYTALGPLRTTDVITITEWVENTRMGVRHSGAVTGDGYFTLTADEGGTRFEWYERLHFPLVFGGRLGEMVAAPLFRWVWRRNLRSLKLAAEAR